MISLSGWSVVGIAQELTETFLVLSQPSFILLSRNWQLKMVATWSLPAMCHLNFNPFTMRMCVCKLSTKHSKLFDRAKSKGIIILNELGLDPGIDHLLAMRFFDQVKSRKGEITSFTSWCGGLPSPEASNNPFGYKFSWSPRGVLIAATNPALYKLNGEVRNCFNMRKILHDIDC